MSLRYYTIDDVVRLTEISDRQCRTFLSQGLLPANGESRESCSIRHDDLVEFMIKNGFDTSSLVQPKSILVATEDPMFTVEVANVILKISGYLTIETAIGSKSRLRDACQRYHDLMIVSSSIIKSMTAEMIKCIRSSCEMGQKIVTIGNGDAPNHHLQFDAVFDKNPDARVLSKMAASMLGLSYE